MAQEDFIVGNRAALNTVCLMTESGRIPHSIVIYGEKGLGKKTLARFIAAGLLCRASGKPCGSCRSCRMVYGGGHPDFITVRPSLKSGAYKLEEDLRRIVSDAYIAPSESDHKVYLIADMDKTPAGSQNALLKLIEEPPDHAVFILTASSREYFLPTILSRVTALSVQPVSREECLAFLRRKMPERFDEELSGAVNAMGGNIGRCLELLEDKGLRGSVATAINAAKAIAAADEYLLLREMWKCDGDRDGAILVLKLLREMICDAAALRLGAGNSCCGCSRVCAEELAERLSAGRLQELCLIPEKYIEAIRGNANLSLCLNAVCAEIKRCLAL